MKTSCRGYSSRDLCSSLFFLEGKSNNNDIDLKSSTLLAFDPIIENCQMTSLIGIGGAIMRRLSVGGPAYVGPLYHYTLM